MLFTLEVLPAAEGDCLLLHWGTAADPKIAVIDGGPGQIYEKQLRPRLDEIVANRQLNRLPLELVMISHMDNDHIIGIKKLMRALKREIEDQIPGNQRTIGVRRLWHNVFNDVLGDAIDRYYETLTASFQASVGGKPNPAVVDELAKAFQQRHGEPAGDAREDAWDVALVLAGHGEGRDVRDDHKFLFDNHETASLNSPFKDAQGEPTLITAEKTPTPEKIDGVEFTIIGPLAAEIDALQKEFDKYIKKNGLNVTAVLAAYADTSIKNLSSIVCLARFGGKTILLTGDARGDKIITGLKGAGLLQPGTTLSVDILKVPHHGSDRNVEPEFFERITADTYVLSGDGKHGNPDRDTLQWIVDARGKTTPFHVVLTYDVKHIDKNRKLDFQKKGKTWNKKRDSLTTFFENTTADGYAFTLQPGAPAKIDLGDEAVPW